MILQTLYQQCVKHDVEFYDEFQVVDLLLDGNRCQGVVAIEIDTGVLHFFHAKTVLFATGGWGRMFQITSNAVTLTGDAAAMIWRAGLPLEDMEFFQIHPTGIYKLGILITEGVRGEGGVLRNSEGERFMERYAPTMKDLASRDVVSRAIYLEVKAGRGVDEKAFVNLDATHLGRAVIEEKLPDIADFCRTYIGVDPAVDPMPVQPTAHYAMGGLPTDADGRVLASADGTVVEGLYASGECACVSVHGANRLGTNSLLDLIVFGKRAGLNMAAYAAGTDIGERPPDPGAGSIEILDRIRDGKGERAAVIRDEMQQVMTDHVSVFREAPGLDEAVKKIRELRERFQNVQIDDKGEIFNPHYREDFPKRNDKDWLKHSFVHLREGDGIEFSYKPVTITRFEPKERTY
jgi:succinate dehydrogenase / fumarate reductase flavoprotein subunit